MVVNVKQAELDCPLCGSGLSRALRIDAFKRRYLQCPDCDFLSMDPAFRLPASAEKKRYELHQNSISDPGYRAFLDRLRKPLIAELRKRYPESKPPRGLDYGSGPQPVFAALMAESGFTLKCWDPYFCATDRADLANGDPWDFIVCCEVAEHFYKPAEDFAFLRSILAPGGFIALMTAFRSAATDLSAWAYLSDSTHVSIYSQPSLGWLAARLGLDLSFPAERVAFLRLPS